MSQAPEPVGTFQMLRADASDPPNIKILRFAVLGMGLILLVGFATAIGRIVYLTSRSTSPVSVTSANTPPTSSASAAPIAPELRLALPLGAKVQSQSLAGNRLAVHYDAPNGDGIIVLDLETGRILSQVSLVPSTK
jgi:hypothetical protein